MALWQLFLGINHEEFPEWYLGLSKTKFISAGLLVVGIFTSSSFLETDNNRFHRMLGGMKWNLQIDKQLQFSTSQKLQVRLNAFWTQNSLRGDFQASHILNWAGSMPPDPVCSCHTTCFCMAHICAPTPQSNKKKIILHLCTLAP